jgi:NAD(P)-dependent dehydrogenase (short-subunit alcohol dehydrogenase family)
MTKSWLITGSNSGFGRALAEQVIARGDRLVATARRPETLDDLVAAAPDRVTALPLDVTDPASAERTVADAGPIDVLVNNAGNGSVGAVEEFTLAELRDLMEVMFFGAVHLTKLVLPAMRERRSGTIVQISSMGGQVAPAGFGAYCAAKFALEAISEALAAEVQPFGVRVLIVEPGSFRTEFGATRMHYSDRIAAYDQTAGLNRGYIEGVDGNQPGDPIKAAAAIQQAVDADVAPLRLALGEDAVTAIAAKHEQLASDLDAWRSTSLATGFD